MGIFHVATATATATPTLAPVGKRKVTAPVLKYPLHATLYRFTLNTANMPIYREWVQWHHDAYQPMIGTLDRERMYFESVFRDTVSECAGGKPAT